MFIWISYLFVNFLCFWKFVMFQWISFGSLNFLCFGEFNMFQFSTFECFCFLIFNTWLGYEYFRVKMSRCQKSKSGIFNARDGQKLAFPKPQRTLIYWMHVPIYIWWTFMMTFKINWEGVSNYGNVTANLHLFCYFHVVVFLFWITFSMDFD